MPAPEPFLIFTRKFHELGIPYMISGSVAAIFYGEPRLTSDVDIIAFLCCIMGLSLRPANHRPAFPEVS